MNDSSNLITDIQAGTPVFWGNESLRTMADTSDLSLGLDDIHDASRRLERFAPLLTKFFPELTDTNGIIESELVSAPALAERLGGESAKLTDRLYVKTDHALPVAGSIKARGGIYGVLEYAERVATAAGLVNESADYQILAEWPAHDLFARHELSVASTGNLGLSIGIMGSALGFRVTVHMSVEAKEWKKKRLRKRGVNVVEHKGDYIAAGAVARELAAGNEQMHFIDDENSIALFLGYSVAALRLKTQLADAGVVVDEEHPLFLYLPCGVGGAPGGITFGARHVFGDHVYCFFAEPTQAPCVLLGLMTGKDSDASVYDFGLKLDTDADGLAVSKPSDLVCGLMRPLVAGCYTLTDDVMYRCLLDMYEAVGMEVEPSSAAGCSGPEVLLGTEAGREFCQAHGIGETARNGTHIIWTTGGSLVPPAMHDDWRAKVAAG